MAQAVRRRTRSGRRPRGRRYRARVRGRQQLLRYDQLQLDELVEQLELGELGLGELGEHQHGSQRSCEWQLPEHVTTPQRKSEPRGATPGSPSRESRCASPPQRVSARRKDMKKAVLFAFGVAICLVEPAVGAHASSGTTYYVSVSSTGSGTRGTSCTTAGFRTITSALRRTKAGDTVVVCPGSYAEHIRISRAVSVRAEGAATID